MIDYTNKDSLYATIKEAVSDNKKLFAIATMIAEHCRKNTVKEVEKIDSEEFRQALSVLDDPVRARAWMLTNLKNAMENAPNAQIAKELRDMLGIASKGDDISIQLINYANAIVDCPHCGRNVHEPVIDSGDN